jgi:Holliday junction resolvase RusA-like endonuclease
MTAVPAMLPWRWKHYQLIGPELCVQVLGQPVPQGSIRSLGKGRPSIHSNAERLLPWRERLQTAIEDAIREQHGQFPLAGPVAIDATFTMLKPKSAPKRRRTFPITRPDGDKLLRAVGDALQNAGAMKDDSQIVQYHSRKVYPNEAPQALHVPGLYLFVYTVSESVSAGPPC